MLYNLGIMKIVDDVIWGLFVVIAGSAILFLFITAILIIVKAIAWAWGWL